VSDGLRVSIVIPTYRRERVLVESLDYLLGLPQRADEIVVVDQTEQHEPDTETRLEALHAQQKVRWIRQQPPSITAAMNRGLREATGDIVLFLDDDIAPEPDLVAAHRRAHGEHADALIAGRVIQPWEEGVDFSQRSDFCFAGLRPAWIPDFMGGNFSVLRRDALRLGGFDENFVRVAYRFEAEFAHRFRAEGGRIRFEPGACLHHLRVTAGGTRSYGEHLTTIKPDHAVGAYYFALRTKSGWSRLRDFLLRPLRAIATRHHLRRPWWIPVTLIAEVRGMLWALRLHRAGPRLLESHLHVS
jgi:GT2 family glycosyltransferase